MGALVADAGRAGGGGGESRERDGEGGTQGEASHERGITETQARASSRGGRSVQPPRLHMRRCTQTELASLGKPSLALRSARVLDRSIEFREGQRAEVRTWKSTALSAPSSISRLLNGRKRQNTLTPASPDISA